MRKVVLVSVPVAAAAAIVAALLIEIAIRVTWDPSRGRPGFILADAARIEKLAANYDGWFAGVPVRTNALGFRDDREYPLAKGPRTFRILLLGDSVTFGHGSIYRNTYPRLLEDRLRAWKPQVDWQVWNLGVPGYNTTQELAYLSEVGPRYTPDLVIVGFYRNDVVDNNPLPVPTRKRIAAAAMKSWLRSRLYSFDVYKKVLLTLEYRLMSTPEERALLDNLAAQDDLLKKPSEVAALKQQQLTSPVPRSEEERAAEPCREPPGPGIDTLLRTPGLEAWVAAVRTFQQLNREGKYRIVFFINDAPEPCAAQDVFNAKATKPVDEYFMRMLSDGTPAVSSHDELARYRPSQMPEAGGHSFGNTNAIKADVLFAFLKDRVL